MSRSSERGNLWRVTRHEWRHLWRDPATWVVSILFIVLVGYALVNGQRHTQSRVHGQQQLRLQDEKTRADQLEKLKALRASGASAGPFDNPADPTVMGGNYGAQSVIMPPAPLGATSLGQDELFPSQFRVSYQSKVYFINGNDIENPWNVMSGRIDLAFVVVYLMPFLIFATSYNMLTAERESGTLRLLASQALRLHTLMTGKLVARGALIVLLTVVLPVVWLALSAPLARAGATELMLWAGLVGAYAAFWFSLTLAVNAFGRSSAHNAMVLLVAWVLLVLVVPTLLNVGVTQWIPSPSRAELATKTRVVTAEAMARHSDLLSSEYDHVGKTPAAAVIDGKVHTAPRMMGNYLVNRDVDVAIRPELDRFDAAQVQRQRWVSRVSIVSPAAVASEALDAVAGSGQRRHAWFMAQTGAFHDEWKRYFFPRIDAQQALVPDDFSAFPRFHWVEESPQLVHRWGLLAIAQLLAAAAACSLLAGWRLRTFSPL